MINDNLPLGDPDNPRPIIPMERVPAQAPPRDLEAWLDALSPEQMREFARAGISNPRLGPAFDADLRVRLEAARAEITEWKERCARLEAEVRETDNLRQDVRLMSLTWDRLAQENEEVLRVMKERDELQARILALRGRGLWARIINRA